MRQNLISRTRSAGPGYHPGVLSLFNAARSRLAPNYEIDIRIGDLCDIGTYACALYRTGRYPNTVVLSDFVVDILDRNELDYLIGHEIGHILHRFPTKEFMDIWGHRGSLMPDFHNCPEDVYKVVMDAYLEIFADFIGVAAAGSVDAAISAIESMNSRLDLPDRIENLGGMPGHDFAEIQMQIRALRLLGRSGMYYELLDMPLFMSRPDLLMEDEYFHAVADIFNPWIEIGRPEYVALSECCDAAFHILLAQETGGLRKLDSETLDSIRHSFRPDRITMYISVEEAYAKISERSQIVAGMDHFLKYRNFANICEMAYSTERDYFAAEAFIREIGGAFGLTSAEIEQGSRQRLYGCGMAEAV